MDLLRLTLRLALIVIAALTLCLPVLCLRLMNAQWLVGRIVQHYFKFFLFVCNIHVIQEGESVKQAPLLLVTNHSSYLDVPILGSLGQFTFTPKLDVHSWPVVGWLCWLADVVYIDRRRQASAENLHKLETALKDKRKIVLFPEGTTSDGNRMLPFKSSFFAMAERQGVTVQPAVIYCDRLGGLPLRLVDRPAYSWYGGMDFVPHLAAILKNPLPWRATVRFLPPLAPTDRKTLTREAARLIAHQIPLRV